MATVWMKHETLPDQPIHVDEKAVPHYQSSGWELTDAPAKPARKKPATADGPGEEVSAVPVEEVTEPAPEKPARRRAPKESDEK